MHSSHKTRTPLVVLRGERKLEVEGGGSGQGKLLKRDLATRLNCVHCDLVWTVGFLSKEARRAVFLVVWSVEMGKRSECIQKNKSKVDGRRKKLTCELFVRMREDGEHRECSFVG